MRAHGKSKTFADVEMFGLDFVLRSDRVIHPRRLASNVPLECAGENPASATEKPRQPVRLGNRPPRGAEENPLTHGILAALISKPLQPERWLSGRKQRFAKASYGLNRIEGSNPSLSATFDRRSAAVFMV